MLSSLSRMASREAGRVARDAAWRLALFAIALVLLSLALVFAGVALFLWLATMMSPALAGASVAGIALVIALVAILIAGRRRRHAEPAPRTEAAASPEELRMEQAEALGKMIARDLRGFPLVITALAVGMIVGKLRR